MNGGLWLLGRQTAIGDCQRTRENRCLLNRFKLYLVYLYTNLPPVLSVPINYNMLEGSSNLHKQCLQYGHCPASLLADRPTACSRFARVTLSPLPVFSSVSVHGLPACVSLHDKRLLPWIFCAL